MTLWKQMTKAKSHLMLVFEQGHGIDVYYIPAKRITFEAYVPVVNILYTTKSHARVLGSVTAFHSVSIWCYI